MPYRYWKFGSVELPVYNPSMDVGAGEALSPQPTPILGGGAYDANGSEQVGRAGVHFTCSALCYGVTAAAVKTQFDNVMALIGKRAKLYRVSDTGDVHWCYARLVNAQANRVVDDTLTIGVALDFIMLSPCWNTKRHGAGWVFDDGKYFDDGLVFDEATGDTATLSMGSGVANTITINNGGNVPVRSLTMTITAGSAITEIDIKRSTGGGTLNHLVYNGTIAAGKSLVIDSGAYSVKNDGVSDYANLAIGGSNTRPYWLEVDPGNNTFSITLTGGSNTSTIVFEFWDGMA